MNKQETGRGFLLWIVFPNSFEFRGRFNGPAAKQHDLEARLMAEFFMDRSHLPDIYRTWPAYFVH
jgi:hypothetical protein